MGIGKRKVSNSQIGTANPGSSSTARHLRDLELYGSMSLPVHDNCSRGDPPIVQHVAHPKLDEVARAQLTVDSQIE
jgi:hypothetical protein